MVSNSPEQLFWAVRWTLRDVAALVVTALVLGAIFYLWGWAMQLLESLLGVVAAGLFYGVWFWAGLLLAYTIRKPGAALLGEFAAAVIAYALGSPLGALVLVLGWVQGMALEMVFAWGRFQSWGLVTMLLSGAMAGTAGFAVNAVARPESTDLSILFAMLWIAIISGAVLGGLVGKILGDRLRAIDPVQRFLGAPVA